MTANDIQAIAQSITAITAAGAVVMWLWRSRRKVRRWRKRLRREEVLDVVIPACFATLVLAILAKRKEDEG